MIKALMKVTGMFREIKYSVFILLSCTLLLHACRTHKAIPVKETVKEALPALEPEEYLGLQLDYRTFSGKASVHLEQKGEQQDFSANIRMQKDKSIWASAIALGIAEVARAMITEDSLQAIVRLNKKAYALTYQEGAELLEADVPFTSLQNLLVGNPLITDGAVKGIEDRDSMVVLTLSKGEFSQVLTYDKYKRILLQLELTSDQRPFKCVVKYGKYGPVTLQQPFAFNRNIVIENKGETVKLDMEYSKAELNVPVETPFTIPASYQRAAVKGK